MFKKYSATATFTANGHSIQVNLPFYYYTKFWARVNCRRMVALMAKNTICYRGAKIDHINVYEVDKGERSSGFGIGY